MWETRDPDGRRVVLSPDRWRHIVERHPYLGLEPDDVMQAVARPDLRRDGRSVSEEWYYRRAAGPSRWTRVVVHYDGNRGFVVTAFPREVASLISKVPETITIAGVEFDNVTYDREGDVLYLWAGEPRKPAHDDASPEGHYLQFGPDGALIAVTIVNARSIFEREGKIPITLPEHRVEANDLAAVLTPA